MMESLVVCKSLVIDTDGKVLLLTRSTTDTRRPGAYDFPGGRVEPQEGFAEAATRELAEEVGIELDPSLFTLGYCSTEVDVHGAGSVSRLVFITHVPRGTAVRLSFEHSAYVWMPLDAAIAHYDHVFYNRAMRYIRDNGLVQL